MTPLDPEALVEAGQMLIGLGRHIQRTAPKPNVEGSQHGEFSVLRKLLPEPTGLYVDCGASDGVDCSNSFQFYKLGWRGLLIDPLPDVWPSLMLNRPGDFLCPIAASDVDGYATLNCCRSVSSLDKCWRRDNESTMPVRTERLETILKRYPFVDWTKTDLLSIDAEGHEKQVLDGIDWNTFKPKVVIIEYADQNGVDISGPWRGILEAQEYRLRHQNQLNFIWSL